MATKAKDVIMALEKMIEAIEDNRVYLDELDRATGDGEHGSNLCKGFQELKKKLLSLEEMCTGDLLVRTGEVLTSNIGGAAGSLYGIAFVNAGRKVLGKAEITKEDISEMLSSALEGVKKIGKAQIGDKTIIDALEPAVNSFREAVNKGQSLRESLGIAVESAKKGAESTTHLEAKKGRASYLGSRTCGCQDPGATSTYLILKAILEFCKKIN